MTVGELRNRLSSYPDDLPVLVHLKLEEKENLLLGLSKVEVKDFSDIYVQALEGSDMSKTPKAKALLLSQ